LKYIFVACPRESGDPFFCFSFVFKNWLLKGIYRLISAFIGLTLCINYINKKTTVKWSYQQFFQNFSRSSAPGFPGVELLEKFFYVSFFYNRKGTFKWLLLFFWFSPFRKGRVREGFQKSKKVPLNDPLNGHFIFLISALKPPLSPPTIEKD
jgi:hypothetical protein